MKFLSDLISSIASAIFVVFVLGIVTFAVFSQDIKAVNFRFFLVQSGSMEPVISTGDIILINALSTYQKNDIVTFMESNGRIVTHRIIDKSGDLFITKGDANRIEDNAKTKPQNILGKLVFTFPKIGYLVDFSKSDKGFLFFIVFPGIVLIISQLKHFFR